MKERENNNFDDSVNAELDALLQQVRQEGIAQIDQVLDIGAGIREILSGIHGHGRENQDH